MDTPNLATGQLEAGKEFIEALEKLGLHASLGLWVYAVDAERHSLVLVTDFFDYRGPLDIYDKMFEAYNATALPQTIDPFVVQFCSPKQIIGMRLIELGSMKLVFHDSKTKTSSSDTAMSMGDLQTHTSWILVNDFDPMERITRKKTPKTVVVARKWNRFVSNVERLAA